MNRVGGKLNPYMSDFGISTMVKGAGAKEAVLWSQRTAMNSADKTIVKGQQRIKEVAQCINIKDSTIDKSFQLYKQICDSGLLKGMSIDARVATCVFMATRLMDQHKPIKKILQYTECSEKELSKCYKKVKCMFPQHQTRLHASKIAEQVCQALKLPIDIT
jgi:transcription initiation factor TFIIIB Brf1 subunit/transcription initiation factor TFIIB